MPITEHRSSYSVIKGQIPDGKCCSCFAQRFNYTISSFPTQGGFWNFLLVGLAGYDPATPALPYHIAFASWSGLCYNHSINGLGSASIVSTHLWLTSTSINLARRCLQLNGGVHRIRAVFMYQFLDTASIRKCDALPTELQTHNQIVLLLSKN